MRLSRMPVPDWVDSAGELADARDAYNQALREIDDDRRRRRSSPPLA